MTRSLMGSCSASRICTSFVMGLSDQESRTCQYSWEPSLLAEGQSLLADG